MILQEFHDFFILHEGFQGIQVVVVVKVSAWKNNFYENYQG